MTDPSPLVLVTGASGFVGQHLIPALTQSGWRVRQAVRRGSNIPNAIEIDSLGPHTDWSAALLGVDAIVHLAARVHHPGEENNPDVYRTVNTEGTSRLATEAAKAGVRHFIQISTILVNGSNTDGRAPFREDDLPDPRGVYGKSKAAAEDALRAIARNTPMSVTVIRPPLIYGYGAGGNFATLAKTVQRGLPLPLASIRNRRGFLAVGNLVSFIQYRLEHPGASFDTFVLADAEQISTPDFVRRIGEASGHRSRLFPMFAFVLKLLFLASGRREAIHSLLGSMEIDTSKARATGWRPAYSLDEGLKATFREPTS